MNVKSAVLLWIVTTA